MQKYISVILSFGLAYSLYVIYDLQNKKTVTKNISTNTDSCPIGTVVESKSSQTSGFLVESKSSQTLELSVDVVSEQTLQTVKSPNDSDYEKLDNEVENDCYDMIPCNNSKKRTRSFINSFFS